MTSDSKPKALVTGGAGFIGSNLAIELLQRGWAVRILDNFSTGKRQHLDRISAKFKKAKFELVQGDLRNLKTCLKACQGMEYVFHQAALRSVPRSVDDPFSTNEINITGTLNLLHAALKARAKRFVYASSSSVYGDTTAPVQHEEQTPRPVSPYAVSKLAGEHYCGAFWKLHGLETVGLRYFNVFGPHQDPESKYSAVIPAFIRQARNGRPLEIHGDGLQSRDFTYVGDVVQANALAALSKKAAGQIYNVGCGTTHSVLELADAIVRIVGKDPGRQHTPPRAGDVRLTHADISRARRDLSYEPQVDFERGLRQTVEYFNSAAVRKANI